MRKMTEKLLLAFFCVLLQFWKRVKKSIYLLLNSYCAECKLFAILCHFFARDLLRIFLCTLKLCLKFFLSRKYFCAHVEKFFYLFLSKLETYLIYKMCPHARTQHFEDYQTQNRHRHYLFVLNACFELDVSQVVEYHLEINEDIKKINLFLFRLSELDLAQLTYRWTWSWLTIWIKFSLEE